MLLLAQLFFFTGFQLCEHLSCAAGLLRREYLRVSCCCYLHSCSFLPGSNCVNIYLVQGSRQRRTDSLRQLAAAPAAGIFQQITPCFRGPSRVERSALALPARMLVRSCCLPSRKDTGQRTPVPFFVYTCRLRARPCITGAQTSFLFLFFLLI